MRKTDINISDLLDDLAEYLDCSSYELGNALKEIADKRAVREI